MTAHARQIDVANMSFGIDGTVDGPCGIKASGGFLGHLPDGLFSGLPGGLLGLFPKFEVVDPFHAAICKAVASGVVMVAAAGNDAFDAGNILPAAYPEVLAVSGYDDTDGKPGGRGGDTCFPGEGDDTFAGFSNFGRVIDIAAPATCIPTTFLGDTYIVTEGTSLAAPEVAGAAALLKSKAPVLPPFAVRSILKQRSEKYALPNDPDGIHEPLLNVRGL